MQKLKERAFDKAICAARSAAQMALSSEVKGRRWLAFDNTYF